MALCAPTLCRFAAFAALAFYSAYGAAQSALTHAAENATPLTIVTPAFPATGLAKPEGTRLDVVGTVLPTGEFRVSTIGSEDGAQAFVDAVAEVLSSWRFVPAISKTSCTPVEAEARFSIWFEGTRAEPHVFVSYPRPSRPPPIFAVSLIQPKPSYPRNLMDVEGQVEMLYLVTPDGEVKSTTVRSSTPYGVFDSLALQIARKTRVSWKEPRPTENMCASQKILFCMTSPVQFPFEGCRGERRE